MKRSLRLLISLLFPLIALFACQTAPPSAPSTVPLPSLQVTAAVSNTILRDNTPIPAVTATPTIPPTPAPWRIAVTAAVPPEILAAVQTLPADRFQLAAGADADLRIDVTEENQIATWVYTVVAPFPTIRDHITLAELQQEAVLADPFTAAAWQSQFPNIRIFEQEMLGEQLWINRPQFAIVPFDQLTAEMKVLQLSEQSVLQRDLQTASYPLALSIGVTGNTDAITELQQVWTLTSNRDEGKLTRITMTGVTALVRATAAQMEYAGILFPAEEVAPILQAADIAHISNEVPFAENCPYPNPTSQSLVFCSRDPYFELLTFVSADVIEVTGNHSNDYGPSSMIRSLDMYETAGMQYYGGGRNLEDARQPALFEDHGNKIAFVGCNPVGPQFAWATAAQAGATPCGDFSALESQISSLAAEGYVVIATMQYQEIYDYYATANQKRDFGRLAAAGATAVSGSQSHHPQAFAFQDGAYIHYGLGNLFFDQMDQLGTRQLFIDNYVIYDNELISVELWTGLLEFYARPRPMTAAERSTLLNSVFTASGW